MTTSHARMMRRQSGLCGQRETVFRASVVEIDIVYTYSPLTTFLWYHHHIGQPFRLLDFSDESCVQKVIYFNLNNLMAIQVETPYSLSNWPGRRDYIQLMRSMSGVNVVMSEWAQANMSMLPRKTCRNCSFASSDKRELT